MIVVRVLALLAVLGIGGSLVAWMITGNSRYRAWAWTILQVTLAILLVVFLFFAIERVM